MDARIEMRKKDFKKSFDDPRRRREEEQVQIRKQVREARLSKKRQQAFDGIDTSPGAAGLQHLERLPDMVASLTSLDPEAQFEANQQFRRLLSIEKNPPIQQVIDSGVVPYFVKFLQDDSRGAIQFEAAWVLTNIASGNSTQTAVVVEHGAVPIFVRLLESPRDDVREQAVWALGNIAGDCPEFRDLVLRERGLEPLLGQIRLAMETPSKVTMLRNATWTLSNLCRGKPRPELEAIGPAIYSLKELIYMTDSEVLTDACWALSYISDGNEENSALAIDAVIHAGVCARLVQLLGHNSYAVQIPALRTVGNIVSGSESQTQTMVTSGCVHALKGLLESPKKVIRKEACWSISNITAGNREQIQEVIRGGLIPLLIQLIDSTDQEVKREAVWALANAASGANAQQIQYLVKCGVIPPLCEALDWNDEKLIGVVLEAMDAILKVGKQLQEQQAIAMNPYAHLIEEAGAFPKLEGLQYAPEDSKIYQMAMKIMTEYLVYEAEGEEGPENGGFADQGFDFSGPGGSPMQ